MCFRPANLSKPVVCPNCGKKIPTMAGIRQKKCPFCKTELPEETITCPECGHEMGNQDQGRLKNKEPDSILISIIIELK